MLSKRIFIFGLFLAVGFLFFNVSGAQALDTWTWDGGGDGHTWTDPLNWDQNDGSATNANNYPGATSTVDVVIANKARVIATTSLPATGGIGSLTLGDATQGVSLNIAGNATIYASSTVTLLGTSTLAFGDNTYTTTVGGASLGLGAGNLILAGYSGVTSTPLTIGQLATFTAGTSTITYAGSGNFYIATTTYYNLSLTPTSTTATRVYTMGMGGNATSTNVLTIGLGAQLNLNGRQLELSGSGTPLLYVSDGSFVANNSKITYSAASATNIATGTYANLVISGTATKSLLGNMTITTSAIIGSGATVSGSTFTVTATGSTWVNNGTAEATTGKIILAGAGVISSAAGDTAVTSFGNADLYPTVHVQITDTSLNFSASTVETKTATVTSASGITDTETVTLTETTASSGIFRGYITFALSGSNVVGRLDYQGGGTVSYTWTDSQDTDDTETGSATFTGTTPGGGSSSSSATETTTVTPAPVAVTTTETPAVSAVTTPAATAVSIPTLESVQTKVAGAIAKIAALPANPTASELAVVQAEIAAILADLQTLTATTSSAPQGRALGYTFVRPLAQGMSHNDVSNLQTALKTDSSIYPGGKVTGYFGPATLLAIKKFQEKYGIASEGQPGYGNVGPKTRAKLNELFGAR